MIIPLARLLDRRGVRCLLAIPPREHWRIQSHAIASVVHLDGSDADAAPLLRILVESARSELVFPVGDPADRLVSQLRSVDGLTHVVPSRAESDTGEIAQELAAAASAMLQSSPDRHWKAIPWSWSDPAPTLQDLAQRIFGRLVPSGLVRTLRGALDLPTEHRRDYLARRLTRAATVRRRATLPPGTRSILFVCHGNRMRSPAAEFFLRSALASTPRAESIWIASAGTHARGGVPADERVRRVALELGASLESHRSQPLDRELVERADIIVAMDDVNATYVAATFPEAAGKIHLLGELAPLEGDSSPEIPDPYFASDEDLELTMKRIHAAAARIAEALLLDGAPEDRPSAG